MNYKNNAIINDNGEIYIWCNEVNWKDEKNVPKMIMQTDPDSRLYFANDKIIAISENGSIKIYYI